MVEASAIGRTAAIATPGRVSGTVIGTEIGTVAATVTVTATGERGMAAPNGRRTAEADPGPAAAEVVAAAVESEGAVSEEAESVVLGNWKGITTTMEAAATTTTILIMVATVAVEAAGGAPEAAAAAGH